MKRFGMFFSLFGGVTFILGVSFCSKYHGGTGAFLFFCGLPLFIFGMGMYVRNKAKNQEDEEIRFDELKEKTENYLHNMETRTVENIGTDINNTQKTQNANNELDDTNWFEE